MEVVSEQRTFDESVHGGIDDGVLRHLTDSKTKLTRLNVGMLKALARKRQAARPRAVSRRADYDAAVCSCVRCA